MVTAAAFDTRNKNDLATQDQNTGEITQYGERKVRGIELGASGMITANWQISGTVFDEDGGRGRIHHQYRRAAAVFTEADVHIVDDLQVPVRAHRGRRRPLHGFAVPQWQYHAGHGDEPGNESGSLGFRRHGGV